MIVYYRNNSSREIDVPQVAPGAHSLRPSLNKIKFADTLHDTAWT